MTHPFSPIPNQDPGYRYPTPGQDTPPPSADGYPTAQLRIVQSDPGPINVMPEKPYPAPGPVPVQQAPLPHPYDSTATQRLSIVPPESRPASPDPMAILQDPYGKLRKAMVTPEDARAVLDKIHKLNGAWNEEAGRTAEHADRAEQETQWLQDLASTIQALSTNLQGSRTTINDALAEADSVIRGLGALDARAQELHDARQLYETQYDALVASLNEGPATDFDCPCDECSQYTAENPDAAERRTAEAHWKYEVQKVRVLEQEASQCNTAATQAQADNALRTRVYRAAQKRARSEALSTISQGSPSPDEDKNDQWMQSQEKILAQSLELAAVSKQRHEEALAKLRALEQLCAERSTQIRTAYAQQRTANLELLHKLEDRLLGIYAEQKQLSGQLNAFKKQSFVPFRDQARDASQRFIIARRDGYAALEQFLEQAKPPEPRGKKGKLSAQPGKQSEAYGDTPGDQEGEGDDSEQYDSRTGKTWRGRLKALLFTE